MCLEEKNLRQFNNRPVGFREILAELKESQKELAAGNGRLLSSLKHCVNKNYLMILSSVRQALIL
jgi:hypothetical protein